MAVYFVFKVMFCFIKMFHEIFMLWCLLAHHSHCKFMCTNMDSWDQTLASTFTSWAILSDPQKFLKVVFFDNSEAVLSYWKLPDSLIKVLTETIAIFIKIIRQMNFPLSFYHQLPTLIFLKMSKSVDISFAARLGIVYSIPFKKQE